MSGRLVAQSLLLKQTGPKADISHFAAAHFRPASLTRYDGCRWNCTAVATGFTLKLALPTRRKHYVSQTAVS
jgi:hypothetical protein